MFELEKTKLVLTIKEHKTEKPVTPSSATFDILLLFKSYTERCLRLSKA